MLPVCYVALHGLQCYAALVCNFALLWCAMLHSNDERFYAPLVKIYIKGFYAGSTVDDGGHHAVKLHLESDTFWHNPSTHKDIAVLACFRMCSRIVNVEYQKLLGHVIGSS